MGHMELVKIVGDRLVLGPVTVDRANGCRAAG